MRRGVRCVAVLSTKQLHNQPVLVVVCPSAAACVLAVIDNSILPLLRTGSPTSTSCDEQSEEPCINSNSNVGLNLIQQQQTQQLHQQQLFISCLYNNLEHLNDFFIDQEEEAIMRLQTLRDSLSIAALPPASGAGQISLTQHHVASATGSPSAHHGDGSSAYLVSVHAKEALVQLHGESRLTDRQGVGHDGKFR